MNAQHDLPAAAGRCCEVEGCGGRTLPHSIAARCALHVSDPDFWYERYLSKVSEEELPAVRRHVLGLLGAQLYRTALVGDSEFATLLDELKKGVGQMPGNAAGADQDACFAVSAVRIGVESNSAYRALVVHFRRFAGATNSRAVALFEALMPQSRYDQMRRARHGLTLSRCPCPPEAILALYTRYGLLLRQPATSVRDAELCQLAGIGRVGA